MSKEKPAPALGTFSAPVEFTVQVGSQSYRFKSDSITFTPVGTESIRALSGKGTFLPVSGPVPPIPVPVPPDPPIPVPPDPDPADTDAPTGVINVKTQGVKGDGSTNDVQPLNALISKCPPGTTLYFPASTYILGDALKVLRPDVRFLGEGDASLLKLTGNSYHVQIGSGQPFSGFSFARLHFYGTPGRYMQDGTAHGGVLNFGSKGTVFSNCLWTGCSEPIMNAGQAGSTYGTVVKDCTVNGWGRVALFLNGGERISGCKLIQDDPNLLGERSSHGIYIHGGASDIEIADTEIANARKYACQIYSEQMGTQTKNVRLKRLKISNCANGLMLAHSQPGAGDIVDCLIEGCTINGVYAGSGIALKNGNGIQVINNVVDGNSGASVGRSGSNLYAGVWAPYEPGFSLSNVLIQGNILKGADGGIWTLPSNGGKFTNIQISGNQVSNCRVNYDITGPGVTWMAGAPASTEPPEGTEADIRPSDDRSPASM